MLLKQKEEIVEIANRCHEKQWMNKYSGNISIFDRGSQLILITPSQVNKCRLKTNMIISANVKGEKLPAIHSLGQVDNNLNISSEFPLHVGVYIHTLNNAVIHAHPPYLTAFALRGETLESKGCPELIIIFKQIPIADYCSPGADNAFAAVKDLFSQGNKVVLLRNHGVLSAGHDLAAAFDDLEAAEDIARTICLARVLGLRENQLSVNELSSLYERHDQFKQKIITRNRR